MLQAVGLNIARIDRRPDATKGPFHDEYFVEVQRETAADLSWREELDLALGRIAAEGGTGQVLGIW